jgi:folate-dependent phosphoribosylglycinamide formyltransferase PurN
LTEQDTVETLEEKIHLLEKEHFPKVIDSIL